MVKFLTPVKDVMLKDFPAIDKDDTLYHALRIMRKYDLDRILAFEKGKLVGVVTKKDIMLKLGTLSTRKVSISQFHVSGFISKSPITITPDVPVVRAARIMVEEGISSLPVVENDKVVGLITKFELASLCLDVNVKVSDIMRPYPPILKPSDTILSARQALTSHDISTAPVVDESERLVGIITIDEISDALVSFQDMVPEKYRKERIFHLLVQDVMRRPTLKVLMDATVGEAAEIMLDKRVKGVAVVNEEDKVLGVLTLTEIAKYISEAE